MDTQSPLGMHIPSGIWHMRAKDIFTTRKKTFFPHEPKQQARGATYSAWRRIEDAVINKLYFVECHSRI